MAKKAAGKKISMSPRHVLIAAWVVTLTSVAAAIIWLQFSYEPPVSAVDAGPEPAGDTVEQAADQTVDDTLAENTPVAEQNAVPDDPIPDTEIAPGASETEESRTPVLIAGIDPALSESGPYGPIPKRATDGREPWQSYATPFSADPDTPLISIVIVGLGLNRNVTQTAIDTLPKEVTLAFSPYGRDLENQVAQARAAGHEVLIMLPTEPLDYPVNDPGPHTLLVSLPVADNLDRLYYVMSRFQGFVGVVNDMGSKFTANTEAVRPLMEELRDRGLMFLDSRTTRYTVAAQLARTVGTARAINNRYIDNQAIGSEIDQHLIDLQTTAEGLGVSLGIGRPYPVTFERIAAFAERLENSNARLAPVTAIANKQAVQ